MMDPFHAALAASALNNRDKVSLALDGRFPSPTREGDALLALLSSLDYRLVTIDDEEYPPLLCEMLDPPYMLSVRGNLKGRYVTVTGARKPEPLERALARKTGRALAKMGFTVVVNGAKGADQDVLDAVRSAGSSLVVLPYGVAYARAPRFHETIVSPFLPYTSFSRARFLERYSVTASISPLTIVLSAESLFSPSYRTAEEALDSGREVVLLPGSTGYGVERLRSSGCPTYAPNLSFVVR